MSFNQDGSIFLIELVDQFIYFGSNISSTESHVNIRIGIAWTAIDLSTTKRQSDLSDKIKGVFFQAVIL